jgi:N-acyl homoserine lactone hydrolase
LGRCRKGEQFHPGGYDVDIVVTGFPGKSVCHGYLGWSSMVLLHGKDRIVAVDTGNMSMRGMLSERLRERGLAGKDVTDVLLTHSHHDHAINWTMFSKAQIVIGDVELDWAVKQPWGETAVPELYARELNNWPTVLRAKDGDEVLPGITTYHAPGHTPGCMIYVLRGEKHDVIFTGDAAKNRAELVSGKVDMTYDHNVSEASIRMIWEHWKKRPGTILVPGHDLPLRQENGVVTYIGEHEAAIEAWFGDSLESKTVFQLTVH